MLTVLRRGLPDDDCDDDKRRCSSWDVLLSRNKEEEVDEIRHEDAEDEFCLDFIGEEN